LTHVSRAASPPAFAKFFRCFARSLSACFKADRLEREGVVGVDLSVLLDEEEFIVNLMRRQELDEA
jgi:hypothetical protein